MRVLIVGKTRMSNSICVGAITNDGRNLRLLDDNGYNQPLNTEYDLSKFWEIDFIERTDTVRPHVEDVLVISKERKGKLNPNITMRHVLETWGFTIWVGTTDELFDGLLEWTNSGSGYISQLGEVPDKSVGIWIPDESLTRTDYLTKVRYSYPMQEYGVSRKITFVGLQEPVDIIPAGTLLRVSLARWWDRNGETEPRCSLQLSGWYDIPSNSVNRFEDDDLPF